MPFNFDPAQLERATPEERRRLIEMSASEDQEQALKDQLALSKLLAQSALDYDSKAPSHPVGGAAYAIGQGLKGYMAGKIYKGQQEGRGRLARQGVEGRVLYYDILGRPVYGGQDYGGLPSGEILGD